MIKERGVITKKEKKKTRQITASEKYFSRVEVWGLALLRREQRDRNSGTQRERIERKGQNQEEEGLKYL